MSDQKVEVKIFQQLEPKVFEFNQIVTFNRWLKGKKPAQDLKMGDDVIIGGWSYHVESVRIV